MKQKNIIDRTKMPTLGGKQSLQLQAIKAITLDNGIQLYIINGEVAGVTRLDVVFDAGTAFQEKKLISTTVNKLLLEGTRSYSSFKISNILDYHGAYLDQFANKDTAGVSLYALTKYYPKLLPLLFEMVTQAVFPEEELRIHLEREWHDFRIKISKVRYKAMLENNKMMFGENTPYGQIAEEKDFMQVTRNDLLSFYKKHYVTENSYLVLSGKSDNKLIDLVNKVFGQPWDVPDEKASVPEVFTANCEQKQLLIRKEDALQSAIRVGHKALDKTHPDYSILILLNTLLGGYFGSRLMSTLREEKGLTYGIFSVIRNFRHGNYFSIATEVNASQTVKAVDEIYAQIEKIKKELVSDEELQLVKNYLFGSFLRGFDGPFSLADRFMNVKDFNLTFDYYKNHLETLMNIQADELQHFAFHYFSNDDLKLLVVGNTKGF